MKNQTLPWWLYLIVIAGAVLMIGGGVIALVNPPMLAGGAEPVNESTRVYAGYLASRNLAIAAMLLGALSIRARRVLSGMLVLAAVVQIFDAIIDAASGRWTIEPAVTILGIAFLIGAARALGNPLWKVSSWTSEEDPRLLK